MKISSLSILVSWLLGPALAACQGGSLAFSDPANTPPMPAYAIGQAVRDAQLDALPGFKTPPAGFGAVPFFWWVGDPLTPERLGWELDQLAGRHLSGLQINYAHNTYGGLIYGNTLPSEPPLFSEAWWNLESWFMGACKQRGIATSLSDYTLGIGQGWTLDQMLAAHPELNGYLLRHTVWPVTNAPAVLAVGADTVSLTAYRLENGAIVAGSGVDLRGQARDGRLSWTPPAGQWQISHVRAERQVPTLDPMHPRSGPEYAAAFFGQFERRHPGEGGKGLNFFFSDELDFRLGGNIWNLIFAAEFQKRKQYDLLPELAALWIDIGPRTPKVRLDYSDVKVALTEEGFFKPVFDWHQARGMTMGCDHGGRGLDVAEFGDYFRTQRWMQGPGADQPGMGKDLIKSKVASSIAHLYQRPRVWLEGWHSSGWSVSSAEATDALFANYAMGYNLLSFHGLYYTTHGGWWEWAPPCNMFHAPYWQHMEPYMACAERLSYLLAQGTHVCDVAILYPVAAKEAGLEGDAAVQAAFDSARALYARQVDLDFMDFESLERAQIQDGRLAVSGESYRVLLLPAMQAVRHSTLEKAAAFARAGGIVIAVGALPLATERQGLNDPEVDRLNRETFGLSAAEAARLAPSEIHTHGSTGQGVFTHSPAQLAAALGPGFARDFRRASGASGGYVLHRQVGPRQLYALYDLPQGEECEFRATGRVEVWNPWTGETSPLPVLAQTATTTRLRLPLAATEMSLLVFSPGQATIAAAAAEKPAAKTELAGDWEFELSPSQDNRWGDYHWPPTPTLLGAEIRFFRYADETPGAAGWEKPDFDDHSWRSQTYSYGPQFWKLGPLPADADAQALEAALAAAGTVNPREPVTLNGHEYRWTPYDFSWRFGVEGDPGYQGYHGLKERLYDEYLRLGKLVDHHTVFQREPEPGGTRYYLWTSVPAPQAGARKVLHGGQLPAAAWLNGQPLPPATHQAELRAGANPLLLRFDRPGTSHFTFAAADSELQDSPPPSNRPEAGLTLGTVAMRWHNQPAVLRFDPRPTEAQPAGWYRFQSAPGLRALTVTAFGRLTAWADGSPCAITPLGTLTNGAIQYRVQVASPSPRPVRVALRLAQTRGIYGGAAIPEPVEQDCVPGLQPLGDWGQSEGLRCYSGGAWYRRVFSLPANPVGQTWINLGNLVSSAELRVNGQAAGIKVAPPWRWDVSRYVRAGDNRLEVRIYNTPANHYLTIPSRYRRPAASGLLGPVTVETQAP